MDHNILVLIGWESDDMYMITCQDRRFARLTEIKIDLKISRPDRFSIRVSFTTPQSSSSSLESQMFEIVPFRHFSLVPYIETYFIFPESTASVTYGKD